MQDEQSPFAVIVYESRDASLWVPRGDPDAEPWERCLAHFLRQLYEQTTFADDRGGRRQGWRYRFFSKGRKIGRNFLGLPSRPSTVTLSLLAA